MEQKPPTTESIFSSFDNRLNSFVNFCAQYTGKDEKISDFFAAFKKAIPEGGVRDAQTAKELVMLLKSRLWLNAIQKLNSLDFDAGRNLLAYKEHLEEAHTALGKKQAEGSETRQSLLHGSSGIVKPEDDRQYRRGTF